jgi:hypothetical protein
MATINNERKRPFIEEPAYYGCPISWAERFFQSKVEEYRKENKEFDLFLIELKDEILKQNITYCDNIIQLIDGKAKTNWVSPKNSLFRMLIKLYNYDFSGSQAVDHIKRCYLAYQRLLSDELEIVNEYEVLAQRTIWNSSIRDFVRLTIVPKREDHLKVEPYFVRVLFCSMQIQDSNYPYNGYLQCDNEVNLCSDISLYEDSLRLFDYYNGNRFSKRVMKIAVSEMIKHNIISDPVEIKTPYYSALLYNVNIKRYYVIEKNS